MRISKGFTIVELLIVIVIIAVLASIATVAYNGIQQRARDNRRAQDWATIRNGLQMYMIDHNDSLPTTESYGGYGGGGWNSSVNANWLSFLSPNHLSKIPIDPLNVSDTSGNAGSMTGQNYFYFYFCYPDWGDGKPMARFGYRSEATGQVWYDIRPSACTT